MRDNQNKYFAGELTSEEKANFLIEVERNRELKDEFIENQNLLALVDWGFSESENEKELAQQKLQEFMYKVK